MNVLLANLSMDAHGKVTSTGPRVDGRHGRALAISLSRVHWVRHTAKKDYRVPYVRHTVKDHLSTGYGVFAARQISSFIVY